MRDHRIAVQQANSQGSGQKTVVAALVGHCRRQDFGFFSAQTKHLAAARFKQDRFKNEEVDVHEQDQDDQDFGDDGHVTLLLSVWDGAVYLQAAAMARAGW